MTQVTGISTNTSPTHTVARDIRNFPTKQYLTLHMKHKQAQFNNTSLTTEQPQQISKFFSKFNFKYTRTQYCRSMQGEFIDSTF
jgi:hypothetical protein